MNTKKFRLAIFNICVAVLMLAPAVNAGDQCLPLPGDEPWSRVYFQGQPDHPFNCTYAGIGCIVCGGDNP